MMGAMDQRTSAPVDAALLWAWDIEPGYDDVHGDWHAPSAEAVRRIRRAMGATSDDPAELPLPRTPLEILRPGEVLVTGPDATLVLEDGTHLAIGGGTPPDLPLGYHQVREPRRGAETVTNLIVSPGRCALPDAAHAWGLTAQLYTARSSTSWGAGDLADLRRLVDWTASRGGAVVGLNPLHAPDPVLPQPNSPYSPSSRRWRDPLYLAIEAVPGADALPDRDDLIARGRALNAGARIDRTAVWTLKRAALTHLWSRFRGDAAFDRYRSEMGQDLTTWAVHCVLTEQHGPDWRDWPTGFRRADPVALATFATDHAYEVGFWAWLQWLLDEQLAASGAPETVIADLAVGFDERGADAWQWQDLVAAGVHVGAPPDLLGPDGQDWGLPPFVPAKLRDQAYRPLAATLRAVARHARGLRIDHVMGLFRLLWVPPAMTAAEGAYVRFAGQELLEVVALESARSGSFVVGEDLGTVEPGVRDRLAEAGVLSTRLLWFEDEPPTRWPHRAMAAITTHDLPTVAGIWTGTDLADQEQAGVTIAPGGDEELRDRLRSATGLDDDTDVETVTVAAHRALARAPSMLVTASLDDLVGAEHRPNLPGTVDQHPNWRIALPMAIDDLDGQPQAEAIAEALADGVGRS